MLGRTVLGAGFQRGGGRVRSRGSGPVVRSGAVVGLPRALHFYELFPLWRAVFERLGFRLMVSPATSREAIEEGTRRAVDEACLPVKAYYGHVLALRDKVDAVFLPRLVSLSPGTYACPKLLGLPDMVRHNVDRLPPVISVEVDASRRGGGLARAARTLAWRLWGKVRCTAGAGERLRGGARTVRDAVAQGLAELGRFREALGTGRDFDEAVRLALAPGGGASGTAPSAEPEEPVDARRLSGAGSRSELPGTEGLGDKRPRVGLVGHAYNLFDPGVNFNLARKLARLGCDVLTSEALSEEEVQVESARLARLALAKEVFWSSGRRVLSAVTRFRREAVVDGIIHLVSFGCGPDSLIGEIAERETRRESDLPYMVLTIDEHTAEAGLVTRLEAFVDMLVRRTGRGCPA